MLARSEQIADSGRVCRRDSDAFGVWRNVDPSLAVKNVEVEFATLVIRPGRTARSGHCDESRSEGADDRVDHIARCPQPLVIRAVDRTTVDVRRSAFADYSSRPKSGRW